LSSTTEVPLHCQVKHLIDLSPGALLPNGIVYHHSLLENEEIKRHIQELLHKGHIHPISSPCRSPIMLVEKKYGTWRLCIDYQAWMAHICLIFRLLQSSPNSYALTPP